MAVLEGAGFLTYFALTGGFGGAPRWFLTAPIALLVLMAIRFPRVASVADWVSTAREKLAMEVEEPAKHGIQRTRDKIQRRVPPKVASR